MARTANTDEPETSDDSVSLTSTVASIETERYEVDRILAERKRKGVTLYLTAWTDYPEHRHEWLPRDSFDEGDVFHEWTRTQTRVSEGLEKPFDVKAWRKRCRAIKEEARRRKERRQNKRLRLSIQKRLTSGLGEQDANIESTGSQSAPRRSDKRIKRRSVHQDPPPSSSISDPSPNSSSKDSDRPLVSRQETEIFGPKSKWTQAETIALEEGLRTLKGPRWKELLALYGRKGTINQVLKDKTASDLYDKAKSVRQEFVDSGREPPEYLKPFLRPASNKGSGTATPKNHSESRVQSKAASKQSSRSTSVDSLMAELHETQRIREAKGRENSQPRQTINSTEVLDTAREGEEGSKTAQKMSGSKPRAPQASQAPARKVEVDLVKKTLKGTPKAAQTEPHQMSAVSRTKSTTEFKESSKDNSLRARRPNDGPHAKEPSNISAIPQAELQSQSLTPSAKEIERPAAFSAAQPESPRLTEPENSKIIMRHDRSSWSGTAKASAARPSGSTPSRPEAVGSGPSRQSSSKSTPKLGQDEPKNTSVTGNITAAWNAEPKKRKSNNWATTNADPVDGQAPKPNYRLSVQNKIFKSRRDGLAPDPNRLVFIDPKTGKAPTTTVSAPSATSIPSKTPLQRYQEELASREAEQRQVEEVEDAMLVSTSEPNPQLGSIDQSCEVVVDEKRVSETGRQIPSASASALRPTVDDMTEGLVHSDSLNPPPQASPPRDPPINAPRIETKRMATMSIQDYTKRSTPSSPLLNEAVINSHQPYFSSDDPSRFTLRSYPSSEQKNELFSKPDNNLVISSIKVGKDDEEKNKVKLVGFGFATHKLLLSARFSPRDVLFLFENVCLASEYQAYFPAELSDYLGSGSIVSYHNSALAVENITETLANSLQGALCFAQQFTMIMYPAGASAWAFLDNVLPNVHPGTTLRFVVRRPLPPITADVHGLAVAQLVKKDPKRYTEITTRFKNCPIQAEDMNINIVFRDMFEIDYDRLVAQNGPQQHPPTNIFFLCFIPQGCESYEPDSAKRSALRKRTSEEHDLFIKFLQANGAKEIYSMQNIGSQEIENNGAWDYFLKNVKSGTIIFHDAFIRYDLVPRLARHLLHGSVNVWKTSLSPMHPAEKHPHLLRLFPHGGVLLLTESFILYQPYETLRMLMWFRLDHIPCKVPGTWKLAVRPRVREWLLDIMDVYSDSGKEIFGCSIQVFANIYTEIYLLLQSPDPGEDRLLCHEWDYEIPTDEAPIVSSSSLRILQARQEWKGEGADREADDDNIRQNDDLLVQWFAEWAIVNLQNFRKYHVILGYTKDHPFTKTAISAYEKAWGHIEVMTSEDAFTRHKVTAQRKLHEVEAERRRKLKEELPAKRAAAKKARREGREATKVALEVGMQTYRDLGATEEEAVRAGRQLLRDLGSSEKEIEECKVDMDKVTVDRWWKEPVEDGEVIMDVMDIREASDDVIDASRGTELALPRT